MCMNSHVSETRHYYLEHSTGTAPKMMPSIFIVVLYFRGDWLVKLQKKLDLLTNFPLNCIALQQMSAETITES